MKVVPFKFGDEVARYYVDRYDDAIQCDFLVLFVQRSLSGIVTKSLDGPEGTEIRKLSIDGCTITFVHDDMDGNCFFSDDEQRQNVITNSIHLLENTVL